MANHASAKKRIRQTKRRTEVNRRRLTNVRGHLRRVEEAITGGDKAAAETAFREVEPKLARSAQKGVIERNTAQRKLSRLSARIKALAP